MPMSPADIEAIFHRARQISVNTKRSDYLDDACGADASGRRRVEALLAAFDEAGDFLETEDRSDRLAPAAAAALNPDEAAYEEAIGTQVGPYKIVEEIGAGGFGTVYLAEQQYPVRRRVALKVIKLGMDTRRVVARFEAERQALALMDHPNIAKVFDGGATASGRPYFAMELVRGVSITDYCDENRLATDARLDLFRDVCGAVQHAHQKGVIHRDLKPSNVLVSQYDDKPVVKVIDFGVAKATADPLTDKTLVTGFRQLIGTPLYMSPEQARQSDLDIDTRSDVYTLGVLLYELLTGTPPFERHSLTGASLADIQQMICDVDPPRPSSRLSQLTRAGSDVVANRRTDRKQLVSTLRGDLDAIVMKCLEKARDRRYESAVALAADIERYQHDDVVFARPPSLRYRAGKFSRRHRVAVLATTIVTLGLLIGSGLAIWGLVQARRDRDLALLAQQAEVEQRRIAQERAESLRHELYHSNILRIAGIINSNAPESVKKDLAACDPDLRHWEYHRLNFLADTSIDTISTPYEAIHDLAFDPTGEYYVLAGDTPRISLHSTKTHERIRTYVQTNPDVSARAVAFSGDGRRMATIDQDRSVFVWDVANGALIRRKPFDFGNLLSVALNHDGSIVAVGSFWDATQIVDVASGQVIQELILPAHRARSLEFFADGSRLMIGSLERELCVWDVDAGTMVWHEAPGRFVVWSASVGPDGETIVATTGDGRIVGFDAADGTRLFDEPTAKVERGAIAIDAESETVFLGTRDGLITAYGLHDGEPRFVLRGHESNIRTLALHPRTGELYSAGDAGVTKRWNIRARPEDSFLTKHHNMLLATCFGAAGQQIFFAGHRNGLQRFDLATGKIDARYDVFEDIGQIIRVDDKRLVVSGGAADSTRPSLAVITTDGRVLHRWQSRQKREQRNRIAVDRGGRRVLSAPFEGGVRVWDIDTGTTVATISASQGAIYRAIFGHDGQTLITIDEEDTLGRWSIAETHRVATLGQCDNTVEALTISHRGDRLIIGYTSGEIEVRDSATGQVLSTLHGHVGAVSDLILTKDDRRLVSCGHDTFIRLWDLDSGARLMNVGRHSAAVSSVAFDDAERCIVSAGEDHVLRIWKTNDIVPAADRLLQGQ